MSLMGGHRGLTSIIFLLPSPWNDIIACYLFTKLMSKAKAEAPSGFGLSVT